jgi:acetyl-CoA synthetase
VLVVMRRRSGVGDETFADMQDGRDHWWHRLKKQVPKYCAPEGDGRRRPAVHPLHQRHDGQAEGHRAHHRWLSHRRGEHHEVRLRPQGGRRVLVHRRHRLDHRAHSYLTYGPLANGATCVVYEGAPDWPDKDRFWQICERYGVTIFYTAPTAIRAFMKWGAHVVKLRSLAAAPARLRG